jgi:hypothetical protein
MIAPAHIERHVVGQRLPRLVDLARAGKHQPRHDERLRTRFRFREPAVDEHLVRTGLCHAPP